MRSVRLHELNAKDPANVRLACDLAQALIEESAFADARRVLDALPETARMQPEARFVRAREALVSGRYDDTVAECEALLAQGCDVAGIRHDLAYAHLCRRDFDAAARTIESAFASHGKNVELLVLMARVEAMRDDRAAAIECADAALALDPAAAAAIGIKALALHDEGDQVTAEALAQQALGLDPRQHEAQLVIATLLRWRRNLDVASLVYDAILERYPQSGRALSGRGEVALAHGDLAQAERLLQRATIHMPDHIGTWHSLAWTQLLQGRYPDAENSYHRAYAIDRNFGDTHGGLALTAALRGEYAEAEKSAERALRLDPRAMTARYARTLILEAQGDTAGAEALLESLLGEAPGADRIASRDFAAQLKRMLSGRAQ